MDLHITRSLTTRAHVLDTAKYRADCGHAFDRFVDHFPYAGLRGDADQQAWNADFACTRRLFYEHFGVDIGRQPAVSACSNHGDGSECCFGSDPTVARDARPRPPADAGHGRDMIRTPGEG